MKPRHFAAITGLVLLAGCSTSEPAAEPAAATATASISPTEVLTDVEVAPVPVETVAPAPDATAEIAQAVTDYTVAYFVGDWDVAFERLWSSRCKAENDARNGFMGTLMAQEINNPDGEIAQVSGITVDRIEGDLATVTYTWSIGGETGTISSQPWVRENGGWRFDACTGG